MSEWKSIKTAPKDGTAVLGLWLPSKGAHPIPNGTNYGITAYNPDAKHWYDASEADNEDDDWAEPDFWMPLPGLPVST